MIDGANEQHQKSDAGDLEMSLYECHHRHDTMNKRLVDDEDH
jgi:hypothetical protein